MKGVLSWFVCWACRAGTREFCSALAALVGQYKIFLCTRELYYVPFRSLLISMYVWAGEGGGGSEIQ
jgi:hypothetical protein